MPTNATRRALDNWCPFTVVEERNMPSYRLHGPDALSRQNIGIQPDLAELFPRIRFYFSAMFMYLFRYGRADSVVGAICVICMICRICACKTVTYCEDNIKT